MKPRTKRFLKRMYELLREESWGDISPYLIDPEAENGWFDPAEHGPDPVTALREIIEKSIDAACDPTDESD